MFRLAWLATAVLVVGCGDDGGSTGPADAAVTDDGAPPGDGDPGDAVTDDSAPDDAIAPDAAEVGTACDTMTCTSTQECCVGSGGRECVDLGACQGVALACDGPEDCESNQVCCAGGGGGGGPAAGGTECRNANQCNANVCRATTDCDGNNMCCPLQQLGVSLCMPQCTP